MTDSFLFSYLHEPPFCFTRSDGAAGGCDVELIERVAEIAGFRLAMVETAFAELIPGLADGRWDITTGLFVTAERGLLADFTRPIWHLPDGLMVARGNPLGLAGYRSVGAHAHARLAVIRDQVQHRAALDRGVPADRIAVFETQAEAADAVIRGVADAYASVAMAHRGFAAQNPGTAIDVVEVSPEERAPERGAFALSKDAGGLAGRVDEALASVLGTPWHRQMMARHGFGDGMASAGPSAGGP